MDSCGRIDAGSVKVDVLFARRDSIYKTLPECDVWDVDRDVRNYEPTGRPVICHPPCRIWGNLYTWNKARGISMDHIDPMEHLWPHWCIDLIDEFGGALEHPISSKIWKFVKAYPVDQFWWGFPAQKRTGLYFGKNRSMRDLPSIPLKLPRKGYEMLVSGIKGGYGRTMNKPDREKTPPDFARWLIEAVIR